MAYFSSGWIVLYLFAALWLWGWITSLRGTSIGQEPWGFSKICGIVLLLFVWPYVAFCMMSKGDI